MKHYIVLLALLITSNLIFCQDFEDDEACAEPEKKILKLIRSSENPKLGFQERSEIFLEAIELNEENAYSHFAYAEFLFHRAENKYKAYQKGHGSFIQIKNQFNAVHNWYRNVIDLCPEFHASVYYKLGYINFYIKGDKEGGLLYFEDFLRYKSNDPNRYPDNYDELKTELKEPLETYKKKNEYAKNFYEKPVPFDPVKVRNVSTAKDEYLPIISPDNELIFYTRRGDERSLGDLQSNVKEVFSVSTRPNVSTDFDGGKALISPFNTSEFDNYGGISLSIDNKEMFICACKFEQVQGQRYKNCDLYVTKYQRSGKGGYDYIWTPLENLGPNINTKTGWEAQPTLSADGNTLYFSAFRKGTKMTDIFYSTRKNGSDWSLAQPVKGPLNSSGHDKSPFLHQDSETMYFASQVNEKRTGAGEAGNFDIFYSKKDESGKWMTPINIGYPINSGENEVGLIVSTDGKLAYIASNQGPNAQGFDLFYFELYEAARPKDVLFVKGEVKDDLGEPVKDATVEITYADNQESLEVKINGDDGKFAAVVKVEDPQDVLITVKKKGYSFDTQIIDKLEIQEMKSKEETFVPEDLTMEIGKLEIGKSFTIDNILFATDSYDLDKRSKFVLNQFIKFLKENAQVTVIIEGHTDDQGDNGKNLTLSKNRAYSAMDYIIDNGISENRLEAVGHGENQPKVENDSETNRAQNRRTDFKLTGV